MDTWALVSGDGLPISGLLTIFRNVVDHAREQGTLTLPVTADLGYSWRPDKAGFFPSGLPGAQYPPWLRVSDAVPVPLGREELMAELTTIRKSVAGAEKLTPAEATELHQRIDALAAPYEEYFTAWFDEEDVDWVVAVNMTLSDAVPVTAALHRAAANRWGGDRPGGVLYWDHDLFGSCAIFEHGERVYPAHPNEFTPVPGSTPSDRWAVVSHALEQETRAYPTELVPRVLTNVLPVVPDSGLTERHREFLRSHGLTADQPVVLAPVRVFAVKGVEIAVGTLAGMRKACADAGEPEPVLLVFGSLEEDPEYAKVVKQAVTDHQLEDAVVFLDGVPVSSHLDHDGTWRLDEIDLLLIARATHGSVLFTPGLDDVETVGLGPALAAVARIPCAVTPYRAFEENFGADFARVEVAVDRPGDAGGELVAWMVGLRDGEAWAEEWGKANRRRVEELFPEGPWVSFLKEMSSPGG